MRLAQHTLIRTDLGFVPGLYSAQNSHLHAEVMRDALLRVAEGETVFGKSEEDPFLKWLEEPYIFQRSIPNLELLEIFHRRALDHASEPEVRIWRDTVYSNPAEGLEFVLEDVWVGISVGPVDDDVAKSIGLSRLPLFNG